MTRARELSKLINPSAFSVNTDNNVGIGSTSPDVKLDVGGAVLVTGISTFENTTQSTSSTTGALIVSGGVGIAKSLNVGGSLSVGGTITYDDVTNIDSVGIVTAGKGVRVTTGGIIVTAGISTFVNATFSKRIDASDNLNVTGFSTFQSKSTFVGIVSCSDVVSSGIVTADYFYGDASNMTNAGISAGKSVALTAFLGC